MRSRREICDFVAQIARVIHTYNCSCNLGLFQGFTRRLHAWTEGIGSSKLGRRDELNLHMNRLRWRQFGSIWLGRREFGSSGLRRVCWLQYGVDKLGGSRLRWSEHGVSWPVLRKPDCSQAV